MLRIALMGVTLGAELSTFGKFPIAVPDESSIELSATELKLPHGARVYVIWRRQIDEKILTWIGVYHHALEIGGSRDGGYYGAGVWLLGTTGRGAAVSNLLDNLSKQVRLLAMGGGEQFKRKLSDIRSEIVWPEQAVDRLGYSMMPIVSGLGLGTGDLPSAYIDLSDPLDAGSLDWCLDSVQTSRSFSGFSRIILSTSAEVYESVKGFGRCTVMTPSQMVRTDATQMSQLLLRAEHAKIVALEKDQALQALKEVQQTLQDDRAEARRDHELLQQSVKQAELLVQKERQAKQQVVHELNDVKQELQYERTESRKTQDSLRQELHKTEQCIKQKQQALRKCEQEFQQLKFRTDGERRQFQDAAEQNNKLRANLNQVKIQKNKSDKELADVRKQFAELESKTERRLQELQLQHVRASELTFYAHEMEPQFDLAPYSYSRTAVAVCDHHNTAEGEVVFYQQRYESHDRNTDTSLWQMQNNIAELENSKNRKELEIADLHDRIAKFKKHALIAVGVVVIVTLIIVGTFMRLMKERDELQAQLDTEKIRLNAAHVATNKQSHPKYFDTQRSAHRLFSNKEACLKAFLTLNFTPKMGKQFFNSEVPLCTAR